MYSIRLILGIVATLAIALATGCASVKDRARTEAHRAIEKVVPDLVEGAKDAARDGKLDEWGESIRRKAHEKVDEYLPPEDPADRWQESEKIDRPPEKSSGG